MDKTYSISEIVEASNNILNKSQKNSQNVQTGGNVSADLEARFQRIEQKVDKLIRHLGVK